MSQCANKNRIIVLPFHSFSPQSIHCLKAADTSAPFEVTTKNQGFELKDVRKQLIKCEEGIICVLNNYASCLNWITLLLLAPL